MCSLKETVSGSLIDGVSAYATGASAAFTSLSAVLDAGCSHERIVSEQAAVRVDVNGSRRIFKLV